MRILSNVPDPRFGGPLKRSLAVARQLRADNIETVFLVPTGDDTFTNRAEADEFQCIRIDQPRIRAPKRIQKNLEFVFGFRRCVQRAEEIIDAEDIDIVHVNGPLNYAIALATARSDASLVWHFNDTLTPTPLKQISATLAERWADQKVVAADAVGEYFFGDTTNTETLYAPVDLEQFDPKIVTNRQKDLRDELGIANSAKIVGTVGNINSAKGHQFLIDAFSRIDKDAHLVIVGRQLESQRAYYEELQQKIQELHLESRVTFAGWRDDIPELLTLFDVFVLASVTEACPMVVLEAMAVECPVIATDVGGVKEQIPNEDYGWVVPPENAERLSTAINTALTSSIDRIERAKNARARVENVFSLEACVEDHVDIYRSLESSTN